MSGGIAYRVFVGAFQTETRARALCDPLVEQGHPVTVAPDPTSGTALFVCRSAQTHERPEAKEIAERIQNEGRHKPIIVAVSSLPESNDALNRADEGSATAALDPKLRREFERFIREFDRFMKAQERLPPSSD